MNPQPAPLIDLSDTVVVVTGAGGGIGSGICTRFAAAGAAVVAHYQHSRDAADAVVETLRQRGAQAISYPGDLTDPTACERLMNAAVDEFGHLNAVVNNAGVQPVMPLAEMTASDWETVTSTNLNATFCATQAAVAAMADGGSITHIASIEGSHPAAAHAHYCASKAGIIMHARSAAIEYANNGIRVNTVSPGLIDRDGLADAWPEGVERWRASAPLARLGTNTDIGNACVFLASDMASFITAHDLVVDGGVSSSPTW